MATLPDTIRFSGTETLQPNTLSPTSRAPVEALEQHHPNPQSPGIQQFDLSSPSTTQMSFSGFQSMFFTDSTQPTILSSTPAAHISSTSPSGSTFLMDNAIPSPTFKQITETHGALSIEPPIPIGSTQPNYEECNPVLPVKNYSSVNQSGTSPTAKPVMADAPLILTPSSERPLIVASQSVAVSSTQGSPDPGLKVINSKSPSPQQDDRRLEHRSSPDSQANTSTPAMTTRGGTLRTDSIVPELPADTRLKSLGSPRIRAMAASESNESAVTPTRCSSTPSEEVTPMSLPPQDNQGPQVVANNMISGLMLINPIFAIVSSSSSLLPITNHLGSSRL